MCSCFLFSFLENFFLLWLIFNMISILLAKNSVHSTVLLPIITIFFFFFFLLSPTAPVAYGNSWARGQIRAATAGLHHSHGNIGSEPHL